ncbi:MAG: EF-P lysine aminoacylase EpmA [Planctomycetota bacterium]
MSRFRDRRIADLAAEPVSPALNIAGRVTETRVLAGRLEGRIADESGSCPFSMSAGRVLEPGDLVRLEGRLDKAGCFDAGSFQLLLRPERSPLEDPEYQRLASPALRRNLASRAALRRTIRDFFDRRGFLEVETGQLVGEPGQEPTLEPFRCGDRYLVTSPELRMKRLLVAGHERIYELSHAYRGGQGERSDWHHPEFTLLEWYRAYAGAEALIQDLEGLFHETALHLTGRPEFRRGDRRVGLEAPFERMQVAEAFEKYAGIDLEPFLDGDLERFRAGARRAGFSSGAGEPGETLFFRILLDRVEGRLGLIRPTILSGYPRQMAALSAIDEDDPRLASRFECYALGVELANAFLELNDRKEQQRRFLEERERKRRSGLDPGPMPERFLAALGGGMPPSAGIALGVDRLLMLLIGCERIADTLPFPEQV